MGQAAFDESLIAKVGSGDGEAFRQLYLASSELVYGYALSVVKNRADAEDIMHDAYIKIHQKAASYQPMGTPMAWVLTIVRNLCYNKLRAARPTSQLDSCELLSGASEAQQDVIDHMVLEKALDILGPQDRQIVVLHALTGLKHREIAQLLGLPEGTVMSKYHRSLDKLKKALAKEGAA